MYVKTKLLIYILDFVGLDFLIKFCTPEVQFIFWILCALFFVACLYKFITDTEKRYLITNGSKFMTKYLFICNVLFIFGCFYLALDAIDSRIATFIDSFFNISDIKWLLVGIFCFMAAYYAKIYDSRRQIQKLRDDSVNYSSLKRSLTDEAIEMLKMSKWERIFLIIGFSIFGVLSIVIWIASIIKN